MKNIATNDKLLTLNDVKQIVYLKSIGDLTLSIKSNGDEDLIEKKIDSLLEILPNHKFFRISDSFIINIDHLKKIRVNSNKNVLLHNGIELELDFKRYPELKWFLKNRYCVN